VKRDIFSVGKRKGTLHKTGNQWKSFTIHRIVGLTRRLQSWGGGKIWTYRQMSSGGSTEKRRKKSDIPGGSGEGVYPENYNPDTNQRKWVARRVRKEEGGAKTRNSAKESAAHREIFCVKEGPGMRVVRARTSQDRERKKRQVMKAGIFLGNDRVNGTNGKRTRGRSIRRINRKPYGSNTRTRKKDFESLGQKGGRRKYWGGKEATSAGNGGGRKKKGSGGA